MTDTPTCGMTTLVATWVVFAPSEVAPAPSEMAHSVLALAAVKEYPWLCCA